VASLRGRTEIVAIEALESKQPFFGTSACNRGAEASMRWRSRPRWLQEFLRLYRSSREWPRTCKHIEGVLAALQQAATKAFREVAVRGTPRIESPGSPWRRNAGIDVGMQGDRATPARRVAGSLRSRNRMAPLVRSDAR